MNRYDTNKDGVIGLWEVRKVMDDINNKYAPRSDLEWVVSMFDTNGDSNISWSEIYNGLK
jgi:Ca2+-binding EF-hand superfamily protein